MTHPFRAFALSLSTAVLGALALTSGTAQAQEHKELGRMWLFDHPPINYFQEAYDFQPTAEWLEKARMSALRYGDGCSASFVSPFGLIMTNNHCAREHVVQVTPEGEDWLADGYFAGSLDRELKVDGLVVRQLVTMEDVTDKVNGGTSEEELITAAEAKDDSYEYELVTLFQGGMYKLYTYKVYDDIRLVGTPELQAAKFGGDPDNFTYPRYSLDYTFMRAYENGKPADTKAHYFKWKTEGPEEGELVFVIGNPGTTGRLKTVAQMEFLRDTLYPLQLRSVKMQLQMMNSQADADPAAAKELRNQILRMENTRKAFQGYLDGLKNERVMNIKREAEEKARALIAQDEELQAKYGGVWDELAEMQQKMTDALAPALDPSVGGAPDIQTFRTLMNEQGALEKKIGEAFFALYGTDLSPDATFTLRLQDGVVKGFDYNGTVAPWFTSFYGWLARNTEFEDQDPFNMPPKMKAAAQNIDPTTRVNWVCTNDIIGGNSGSAIMDRDLNVVGLVFDGNIESLGNNYVFTDDVARTVNVHTQIIIETMRKVYGAGHVADELEKGTKPKGTPAGQDKSGDGN